MAIRGSKVRGKKEDKEAITVLLAGSAAGEKLKPLCIGKSKKPRDFKDKPCPRVDYKGGFNRKAWMNRMLFENWVHELNEKMKEEKRHILLLVDNASAHHLAATNFSNVRLEFIDPNCTSALQPMDAGVIRSFKAKFYDLMYEQFDKPSLYEALQYVETAWRQVHPDTLIKSFKNTGILGKQEPDLVEPCKASTSAVSESHTDLVSRATLSFKLIHGKV